MAAAGQDAHVHLIPSLPDSVTSAVGRTGWLEDWRLAAALLAVATGLAAAWAVRAVLDRRAGRRHGHRLRRRVGLGGLVALLTLAGGGAAVNAYAGYAPDLTTLERTAPGLVGIRSTGGPVAGSALPDTGRYPARLTTVETSDPSDRIPTTRAWVYLPPGYDDPANARSRYPVVYLVHGWPGTAYDWFGAGRAGRTAALMQREGLLRPMILVAPDASGGTVRDTECLDSTAGGPKLETYLTRTVVATVDRAFRTIPDRSARALGGVSSGGYCALNLGLRHQDVFSAVLAMMPYGDPGANATATMLGGDALLRRENSPAWYAGTIPLRYPQAVFAAAGRDDRLCIRTAERAVTVLGDRGDYVGLRINPGLGHDWREARFELPYALAFASARLAPAQPGLAAPGASAAGRVVFSRELRSGTRSRARS